MPGPSSVTERTASSPSRRARRVTVRFGVGPILYTIATLAAFIAPWLSFALFIFMAIFYMLPVTGSSATSE